MNPMHSSRQSIGACKRNEFWRFSLMDRASSAPICPFLNTLVRPRTDGAGGALLEHHLVDELKLWIHPVLIGRGQLLFREGDGTKLGLIATKVLGTGVIVGTYRPARA